ncbi:MAG: two-component system response regulator NreC [Polaribacter sp.]|jgi:two-component system response regulator NreC
MIRLMIILQSQNIIVSNIEKEILQLTANGKTSKEIIENLFIAKTTVDTHPKNMILKLNLSSGNEFVKFAIETKYKF